MRRKRKREETALDRYYQRLSVIKGSTWQVENEWRLLWRNRTESADIYKIPITTRCIKSVYLGYMLRQEERAKALEATAKKFPNAQIWQGTKRHGNLSIYFEPVEPRVTA
jgi:hypothetical protein